MSITLKELPIEIFEDVLFEYLSLKDWGNLKKTCKLFSNLRVANEEEIKEEIKEEILYQKEVSELIELIHSQDERFEQRITLEYRINNYISNLREKGILFPEIDGSLGYFKNFRPPLLLHYLLPLSIPYYNRFREIVRGNFIGEYFIPLRWKKDVIIWYDAAQANEVKEPFYKYDRERGIVKIRAIDYLRLFLV